MSSYPLTIRAEAAADIRNAYDWYQSQQPGLGLEFFIEVEIVFDRLRQFPEVHPIVYRDTRQALLRRFPYVVYYLFEQGRVEILAVFHASRDPETWRAE